MVCLIPALTIAQENNQKKKAYYFYGDKCPHCTRVEQYFEENGIFDKYEIAKLECTEPFSINNAKLLNQFFEAYNVPAEERGVPVIVFDNQILRGDQPIIDNFVQKIDASTGANELPDPTKVKASDMTGEEPDSNKPAVASGSQGGSDSATAASKSRRNIAIAVIGLLIVIGAIYILNKDKSK